MYFIGNIVDISICIFIVYRKVGLLRFRFTNLKIKDDEAKYSKYS